MDHLPLPCQPTAPLPRVPYVCGSKRYDGKGFLTYPSRVGWPQASPETGDVPFWIVEQRQPSDDKELESLLQSWIFFGLLHQVFAPVGLYHATDYTEEDELGSCIHTKGVSDTLRKWHTKVKSWRDEEKRSVAADLSSCLRVCQVILLALLHGRHPGFNRTIHISLVTICGTISGAAQIALINSAETHDFAEPLSLDLNESERQHMLRRGWCPAEIASTSKEFESISSKWYIQHMLKRKLDVDHAGCNADNCESLQIDVETYQPRHIDDTCRCALEGPDLGEVTKCLSNDSFPILDIVGEGKDISAIRASSYESGTAYVAISHVWADGLGNPSAMQLPQCQIQRLRGLVQDIQGRTWNRTADDGSSVKVLEQRRLLLWCDSLCCPIDVDNESQIQKARAIAKLGEVYTKAEYVLVLDRSLECFSFAEIGPFEAIMRILTSRWLRRLWTLQEGGLAKKLLIRFADTTVDFRDLWQNAQTLYLNELSYRILARDVTAWCANLRSWFNQRASVRDFRLAVRAVCYRRVSVQSDEPICIAAVFEIGSGSIAVAKSEDRMKELWGLLSKHGQGVPESIILSTLPRIAAKEWRWAPSTLQQSPAAEVELIADAEPYRRGIVTARGLRVSRAGWRICTRGPPTGIPEGFASAPENCGAQVISHVRTADGEWYAVMKKASGLSSPDRCTQDLLNDRTKDWYLILESHEKLQLGLAQRGLLTSQERHDSGLSTSRSQMVVWLMRIRPAVEAAQEKGHQVAWSLRSSLGVRALWLLHTIEIICQRIQQWMPGWFRYAFSSFVVQVIYPISAYLRHRLAKEVERACTNSAESPIVHDALEVVGEKPKKAGGPNIAAFVVSVFMGRVANVVEIFDDRQTWYVD